MPVNAVNRARCEIVAAGVLWSTSGLFSKVLTEPTSLGLHDPRVEPLAIAFYRSAFAGLLIAATLRSAPRPTWQPVLVIMPIVFATMSGLFITAMAAGQAASAILLQYTAPVWVLVIGWVWLREPVERRDGILLAGGLAGVAVLIMGNWSTTQPDAIAAALGSGLTYAGVILCLRCLREQPSRWLTAINMLGTTALLAPFAVSQPLPSPAQLGWLALFGIVQLAIPYWFMARGLQQVPSFEAGLLTLVEPVLNPLWAWLVSPATEKPTVWTWLGGGLIVGSLAVRYWPQRKNSRHSPQFT